MREGLKGARTTSMHNVLIQLQKCCNHPFLIDGVRQVTPRPPAASGAESSEAASFLALHSGKLRLLEQLLLRLRKRGHRVLLFSQMVGFGPGWRRLLCLFVCACVGVWVCGCALGSTPSSISLSRVCRLVGCSLTRSLVHVLSAAVCFAFCGGR